MLVRGDGLAIILIVVVGITQCLALVGLKLSESPAKAAEACWITSQSPDGLGHQLHGMITVMSLNGLQHPSGSKFKFDCTPRGFKFEHADLERDSREMANFMQGAMQNFLQHYCLDCIHPGQNITRESLGGMKESQAQLLRIKCAKDITYVADSAMTDLRITDGDSEVYIADDKRLENIRAFASEFTGLLPNPELPSGHTTVVHVRLTDSGIRGRNPLGRIKGALQNQLQVREREQSIVARQLDLFKANGAFQQGLQSLGHNNTNIIIHTDNMTEAMVKLDKFKIPSTRVYGFDTPALFVLSQMVHADVLITSDSSFSVAAAFLRNQGNGGTSSIMIPRERTQADDGLNDFYPPHVWY